MDRLLGKKNVRRYWIDQKKIDEDKGLIDGEVFHHIVDVCRQNLGSKFELLTDESKAYFVEIVSMKKNAAQVQVIEVREIPLLARPHLVLNLSVPRFPVFEEVVEKCVELGVFEIQLFFSEHSFVRTQNKISSDKLERWNRIVKSSTQQTGRGDLMKIHPPLEFSEVLEKINQKPKNFCLFAYEGDPASEVPSRPIKDVLRQVQLSELDTLDLIVGSEGGFSTQEVKWLHQHAHHPVHFGTQILRVETACTALLSILKYEAGI